jgi:hypothetical protein
MEKESRPGWAASVGEKCWKHSDEIAAVEAEARLEPGQVEEILPLTVADYERHGSFRFLGNHGLSLQSRNLAH